jgi:hypothetical protein
VCACVGAGAAYQLWQLVWHINSSRWCGTLSLIIESCLQVVVSVSECGLVILYIRGVDMFLGNLERTCSLFKKILNKLSGCVLIIGSQFINGDEDSNDVIDKDVSDLFP